MTKHLPLSTPHMSDEGFELEFIHDAFRKNWIAPLGENVTGFENDIAAFTGADHPVALSAGTAALHLSLILSGVKAGDMVFCQDITFSASANPIAYLLIPIVGVCSWQPGHRAVRRTQGSCGGASVRHPCPNG